MMETQVKGVEFPQIVTSKRKWTLKALICKQTGNVWVRCSFNAPRVSIYTVTDE